jgi:hypothetical protein
VPTRRRIDAVLCCAVLLAAFECEPLRASALWRRTSIAAQGPTPDSQYGIRERVAAAYMREFGLQIASPVVFAPMKGSTCPRVAPFISTAYLRESGSESNLFVLYLSEDASRVLGKTQSRVLTPAGTIRVLVVLVRHRQTFGPNGLDMWMKAQSDINDLHAAFAAEHGYAAPIVIFDNRNVVLDATSEGDGDRMLTEAVPELYQSPYDRDVTITVDIDPDRSAGGSSNPNGRSIVVGNYMRWNSPLTQEDWTSIARTAYQHEMAHLWGWEHRWSPVCDNAPKYDPFVAAPALFGWTDTDGDSIPEILDDTPYGRPRP